MDMNNNEAARSKTGWSGVAAKAEVGEEGFNSGFAGTQGSCNSRMKLSDSMVGRASGYGGDMTDIPIRLLDSFIPGYSIVSALILETSGIDISKIVGAIFVLLTFVTAARYVWGKFWRIVRPWCNCTVTVGSEDVIFDHLMFWVGRQAVSENSRSLIASSKRHHWEADDLTELFLAGKWTANYTPGYGTPHRFWYKGNYFTFNRETKETGQVQQIRRGRSFATSNTEQERIYLSCLGRRTDPIKNLISDAKQAYTSKKASTTTVRVPNSVLNSWTSVSTRPSRSMTTLSLSKFESTALLKDISEYLAPDSARWYAAHGIPYRRGYLFHGPPGTGKTSFSLVLAGMFGLEIHVLSLLDIGLTESKLQHLFLSMPSRCIVLLEDVDSAGFTKKKEIVEGGGGGREGRGREERVSEGEGAAISLSCLLNVIDGVASHEGRILIMTTNHPERIDPRLVRAGRVDLKVLFGFANHDQIVDLFVKMYDPAPPPPPVLGLNIPGTTIESKELELGISVVKRDEPEFRELVKLGRVFAGRLPGNELTPAEIQGFLLVRRESRERALNEVEDWLRDLRADKEMARRGAEGKEASTDVATGS